MVMVRALERFADWVAHWTGVGVIILMGAVTALVTVSVILRYGFSTGIVWGEEVARYLMIWMGFLGASLALRKGAHVGVEMLRARLPLGFRRVVTLVASLAAFFFFAMVLYQGSILVVQVAAKESIVLPVSMLWFYLSIPVGAVLMLIQMAPIIVREWRTGTTTHESVAEERLT